MMIDSIINLVTLYSVELNIFAYMLLAFICLVVACGREDNKYIRLYNILAVFWFTYFSIYLISDYHNQKNGGINLSLNMREMLTNYGFATWLILTNVIYRRRWVQELKFHRDILYNDVFYRAPVGQIIIDNTGTILAANNKLTDMLGYKETELLGETINMLLPEKYRCGHLKKVRAFLNGNIDYATREVKIMHKNKSISDITLTITKVSEIGNKKIGMGVIY